MTKAEIDDAGVIGRSTLTSVSWLQYFGFNFAESSESLVEKLC